MVEREIGKSRTAREKENRLVKIGRYLALFSLRRTKLFCFFFLKKTQIHFFLSLEAKRGGKLS